MERKQYGLFRVGCPNLIWELNRARREQLSAQQLLTRNVSERIVDKDNHLRDCLKYLVLSLPATADTPIEVRLAELAKRHPASLTNVMIQRRKLDAEMARESEPIFIGARAKLRQLQWRHAMGRRRRF